MLILNCVVFLMEKQISVLDCAVPFHRLSTAAQADVVSCETGSGIKLPSAAKFITGAEDNN